MANTIKSRSENVSGDFFVDETCIDCDACRWIAPEVFKESGGQSAVYHQPANSSENEKALKALVCCPTASIGTRNKHPELSQIASLFPVLIEDNVFYCGYHSEKSYGAASYFIQRKEGNILIDSPRFAAPLVKRIEELGGIRYLYLTHRDDVADHELFAKRFGCERILHADDVDLDTAAVEIKPQGTEVLKLAEDILIIPVPGHTKGHTVLLYKQKFLFTGDHLAYSPERTQLVAFRSACWYSWSELIKSMQRLSEYSFEFVLPGHGRRFVTTKEQMHEEIKKCITWMKTK